MRPAGGPGGCGGEPGNVHILRVRDALHMRCWSSFSTQKDFSVRETGSCLLYTPLLCLGSETPLPGRVLAAASLWLRHFGLGSGLACMRHSCRAKTRVCTHLLPVAGSRTALQQATQICAIRMGVEENCAVCMERPRKMRFRPCGHAVCCELCTIRACEPMEQCLKCPTCRVLVEQLELVTDSSERMESYQAAAQPGAWGFESLLEFLKTMESACSGFPDHRLQEVAGAARAVLGRWEGEEANLMNAAAAGNTEAVAALLTVAPGLDVNAAGNDGRSALMRAAFEGHTETVALLATVPGLDVDAVEGDGYTALTMAARKGHTDTVAALLAIPGLDVNTVDGAGYTALMMAALEGHTGTVAVLLAAAPGLKLNMVDQEGDTALMTAASKGHTDTVMALVAASHSALEDRWIDLNAANPHGYTALIWAAIGGHMETVVALLALPELDVDAAAGSYTALTLAEREGYNEIASLLRSRR